MVKLLTFIGVVILVLIISSSYIIVHGAKLVAIIMVCLGAGAVISRFWRRK